MGLDGWGCIGVGGAFHLLQALKSLSSSDPWVTHWAGSCLAFSNANDEQRWKPQIGPCNSACGVWWGPAHVGDRGLSPASPPSPPGLLCAAVIGTDVPLASHRATFPLIATLYVDSFHLPQQLPLSPFSSLPLQFSPTLSYTFSFSLHHSPDLCEMAFPDAPQISPSPDPDCLNVELWRWRKARREGDGRTEGVKRGQGDFFVCVIWEWVKKGKGKKKGIWARLSLLQLERIWNIIPL